MSLQRTEKLVKDIERLREALYRCDRLDFAAQLSCLENREVLALAWPVLEEGIQHTDAAVRELTAYGIGGRESGEGLSILARALCDTEIRVRLAAVRSLRQIACNCRRSAIDLVIPVLRDPAPEVRLAAASALARFIGKIRRGELYTKSIPEPARLETVRALAEEINDSDPKARGIAANAVGRLGESSLIPALSHLLDDTHTPVAIEAAWSLTLMIDSIAAHLLVDKYCDRDDDTSPLVEYTPNKSCLVALAKDLVSTLPIEAPALVRLPDSLIDALLSFYKVGQAHLGKRDGAFKVATTALRLKMSRPTFLEQMKTVIDYFREHFAAKGHPEANRPPFRVAGWGDVLADEENRIITAEERRGGRICEPVGRWAWELTRELLERQGALPVEPDEVVDSGNKK